ncbi:MAG: hypothetical protein HY094_01280 [Candidatus Melainabacteria bacterium]|nr:hypothetical protein [Candidatus Melainabacteria bacterium]
MELIKKNQRKIELLIGLMLIIVSFLLNESTINSLLYEDGKIKSVFTKLIIYSFDLMVLICGLNIVLNKKRKFFYEFSVRVGLGVSSLLLAVFILELLFPLSLPFFSLKLQDHLMHPSSILCQSSKKHLIPKEYIAIIGDSYADGEGDWFFEVDKNKNPKYYSAHVLHDLLKKDVISFGVGGAGSPTAVKNIVYSIEMLRSRFHIEAPEVILFYFFEGNDLEDNLVNKERVNITADSLAFSRSLLEKIKYEKSITNNNFIATSFFINLFRFNLSNIMKKEITEEFKIPKCENSLSHNVVEVNGKIFSLPDCTFINSEKVNKLSDDVKYAISLNVDDLAGRGLTKNELETSFKILKYSLNFLVNHFPNSKIIVVYIPSLFSSYSLKTNIKYGSYSNFSIKEGSVYTPYYVTARSNLIANHISQISNSLAVKFLDTRPSIKLAASKKLVHGPLDWGHFNRYGYEALSKCIASYLLNERLIE